MSMMKTGSREVMYGSVMIANNFGIIVVVKMTLLERSRLTEKILFHHQEVEASKEF